MKEITGKLFQPSTYSVSIKPDVFIITTNGFVTSKKSCVMGRGCALEAAKFDPEIPYILGNLITNIGNQVHLLRERPGKPALVSFPVKPISEKFSYPEQVVFHMRNRFKIGDTIPGWACIAKPELIEASAYELVTLVNKKGWQYVVCPRFGSGAGNLNWSDVKEIVSPILDNRFYVINFK